MNVSWLRNNRKKLRKRIEKDYMLCYPRIDEVCWCFNNVDMDITEKYEQCQ